jgi:hypothetical protein
MDSVKDSFSMDSIKDSFMEDLVREFHESDDFAPVKRRAERSANNLAKEKRMCRQWNE